MGGTVVEMSQITCTCGGRSGFTCVNGWWVCATCRLPRRLYLEAVLNGTASYGKENDMGLIVFEGGSLDGTAYETKTLLGAESLNLPIFEYVWTSEKRTSEKTGAVAQVWRHHTLVSGATPPQGGRAAVGTPETAAVETPTQAPAPAPAVVEGPVDLQSATMTSGTAAGPETSVTEVAGTNTATPAGQPVQGGSAATGELPSGESLLARRKALKLSRGDVVDRCGLAHSKIASIEAGTGKRVKDEEIRLLADTLAQFEAERGGAGARP